MRRFEMIAMIAWAAALAAACKGRSKGGDEGQGQRGVDLAAASAPEEGAAGSAAPGPAMVAEATVDDVQRQIRS